MKVANETVQNLAVFKYLRRVVANQNGISKQIKGKLNLGNACCHKNKVKLSVYHHAGTKEERSIAPTHT
jgi:hypothetical protein